MNTKSFMKGIVDRRRFLMGAFAAGVSSGFPTLSLSKTEAGYFDLRAKKTDYDLMGTSDRFSKLWLYDGVSPGPEIRVVKGDTVRVRFTNELDAPTSIHWHGIRIINSMDGVAGLTQEPVQPGETFDYVFQVPDSGTFWYHAHNKSWVHVARGLYGPLIVDDLNPVVDRSHDITLMLDDWRIDESGRFDLNSLGDLIDWSHAGRLGNWLTTNGQSEPMIQLTKGETYRLRLINAANARIFQIDPSVIDARIIGYDGFLFNEPRPPTHPVELIMPAQRLDLLVIPQSVGTYRLNDVGEFGLLEVMQGKAQSLAIFEVSDSELTQPTFEPELEPNDIAQPNFSTANRYDLNLEGGAMGRMSSITYQGRKLSRRDLQRTRQFWSFNGVANLAEAPFFKVKSGSTVVLRTVNQTGWPHAMHLHGHHFQISKINGKVPKHVDWRDTFSINGHEEVEITFVADNPGKWLLHCHMLEHAAAGMNTWFEVT